MGDLYTPPTLLDYNENPPPDDGSRTAKNLSSWAGVLGKLTDPLKTFMQSVNSQVDGALNKTVSGGPSLSIVADYTMLATDQGALLVASGATAKTITLVSPAAVGAPFAFSVCNVGDGAVFVTPPSGVTLNGLSTVSVAKGQSIGVQTDGTNFFTFGGYPGGNTGDIVWNFSSIAPAGFIWLQGTKLGNSGSGANYSGDIYSPLYSHLWTHVDDAFAVVSGGRGSTADNDFNAGKTLQMPGVSGRSVVGVDINRSTITIDSVDGQNSNVSGGYGGYDMHTLTLSQAPAHTHDIVNVESSQNNSGSNPGADSGTGAPDMQTTSAGGGAAHNNMAPWRAMYCWIRL